MKKSRIIALLLLIPLLLSSVQVFYAKEDDSEEVSVDSSTSVEGKSPQIASVCTQANNSVGLRGRNVILTYTTVEGKGTLYFSNKNYSNLDSDEKEDFMETALQATTRTSLNAKTKNKVYNFIAGQDTPVTNAMKYLQSDASTDFLEAKKWFDPFSGVIGTILGVLCVAVFLFTGMSILFDVCYLVLPGVQAILERGEEDKKPFGVSKEAYYSLKDSERDDEYKNVVIMYLKRRMVLFIIMAICVGYLISGKLYDVIAYFIDAFSQINVK